MRFQATIVERPGPTRPGVWAGFLLPPEVVAEIAGDGADHSRRKRILVRGTFAGLEFRSTVSRQPDGWEFITGLNLRRATRTAVGDTVEVDMAADTDERVLEPPPDVAAALGAEPGGRTAWDALPWSHRREYVMYLDDAKRPETRAKRVGQVAAQVLSRRARPYGDGWREPPATPK
jgi:hypothetical protein